MSDIAGFLSFVIASIVRALHWRLGGGGHTLKTIKLVLVEQPMVKLAGLLTRHVSLIALPC